MNFYTNNTQKMTILGNNGGTDGFVGIGNVAPPLMLTLGTPGANPDGSIIAFGTHGSGATYANGLTENRFIWYSRVGAIRAGNAVTGEWNTGNVGNYSAAFGYNTTASGQASFACGSTNIASAGNAFASGDNTTASGLHSMAVNCATTASG
jgi:hypothetical protein